MDVSALPRKFVSSSVLSKDDRSWGEGAAGRKEEEGGESTRVITKKESQRRWGGRIQRTRSLCTLNLADEHERQRSDKDAMYFWQGRLYLSFSFRLPTEEKKKKKKKFLNMDPLPSIYHVTIE